MKKISDFFKKIKDWTEKHKTLFALIITALFVGVHIPLLVNHEIWNDEGVVWSLSKEVNLSNVYEVNSAEPHPLLWQFMLAPLSQNNFPIISMNILSLVIVALAVFLFVRFAPFNFFIKLIFILSSSFAYFNPIIARDYALIPLAICLVCITYKNRHEKPLLYGLSLALLSQTHFLMYGLLAALAVMFIFEETTKKKPLSKVFTSIIICLAPVALSILSSVPIVFNSFQNQGIITGEALTGIIDYSQDLTVYTIGTFFGYYVTAMNIVVPIVLVIMFIGILAANLKAGLLLLAGSGFWCYVLATIYPNYFIFDQKVAILSLLIMFTLWIIKLEEDDAKENFLKKLLNHSEIVKFLSLKVKHPSFIIPCLLVALTIPQAINSANNDFKNTTRSSNNAKFVNENIEDGSLIIEGDVLAASNFDMAAYLQINKKVDYYNVPLKTYNDYNRKMRYDGTDNKEYNNFKRLTDDELASVFSETTSKYEHVYYATARSKNCQGQAADFNEDLMSKYEALTVIDQDDYLESYGTELKIFRIK